MREYDPHIFDFDNTLFDSSQGIVAIMSAAMDRICPPYDRSMFPVHAGMTTEQAFEAVSGDPALRGGLSSRVTPGSPIPASTGWPPHSRRRSRP